MYGGQDMLTDLVLEAVLGGSRQHQQGEDGGISASGGRQGGVVQQPLAHSTRHYDTLCPRFLCRIAGWVCPF